MNFLPFPASLSNEGTLPNQPPTPACAGSRLWGAYDISMCEKNFGNLFPPPLSPAAAPTFYICRDALPLVDSGPGQKWGTPAHPRPRATGYLPTHVSSCSAAAHGNHGAKSDVRMRCPAVVLAIALCRFVRSVLFSMHAFSETLRKVGSSTKCRLYWRRWMRKGNHGCATSCH